MAVDCTISYPVAVRPGARLVATAVEQNRTNRLGFCDVTVTDESGTTVGHFRGTVYRTTRPHDVPADAGTRGATNGGG